MANSKSRLGRGLGGLISGSGQGAKRPATPNPKIAKPEASSKSAAKPIAKSAKSADAETTGSGYTEILLTKVSSNPYQPRRDIEPKLVEDLANSIRSEGLLQPIVVRRKKSGYELIAGERRLRAFKHLNMAKIPARVIEASDASSATLALIENLQRENLNPIDEAMGFASLVRDFDLTQEAAAARVGKSRAVVANALRLLSLSPEVQGYLSRRLISTGHAKVIMGLESSEQQKLLARRVIESGMSVREAETQVKRLKERAPAAAGAKSSRTSADAEVAAVRDLEKRIGDFFNTRVAIRHGAKKGKLTIEYFGNDDLERILEKLGLDA